MKPFLDYPVKPFAINQEFGANPDYYARFKDSLGNPEKGHMGIDLMAIHATPLFAPCDGMAWYAADIHGGDGIYIRTQRDGQWYNVILWHLCSKDDPTHAPRIPTDGTKVPVKTGQLIGFTDNTGAPYESSGDHLHLGVCPTDDQNHTLYPNNGFNGCVDPEPFFTGDYAELIGQQMTLIGLLQQFVALLRAKLSPK